MCFASAASCWALKSGEKAFDNTATSYNEAAREAEASGDMDYASLLYKYAAVNFEREMEFINFSECFYRSKECYRKFLTFSLFNPKKIHQITRSKVEGGIKGVVRRIFSWFVLTLSFLVWGHGERPIRTLYFAFFLIFSSALLYTQGYLIKNGAIFDPDLFEAVYFSVVTFTTVGYGDITPVGFNKLVVVVELICGIFIVPIFIIGFSRKYLRI